MSRESSTNRAKHLSRANDRRFLGNSQMIHSDVLRACMHNKACTADGGKALAVNRHAAGIDSSPFERSVLAFQFTGSR